MAPSDNHLLSAFAEHRDERAFAELVAQRIDFVYAAALRQVNGDVHRARDITQEVFIKVAREAAALRRHPSLLGWLCTTTRHAAVDAIRREQRRKHREQEAEAMPHDQNPLAQVDWARLQPVLDEALVTLSESDREAVLARYFDRQSFADISARLGVSENAAQRRVERALDKLRLALARKHVTSTSAALGLLLANQPIVAAPASLASGVTQAALGATTGAGAGVLAFMTASKITVALLVVAASTGAAVAVFSANAAREAKRTLADAVQRNEAMARRTEEATTRLRGESARVTAAEQENARLLALARTTPSAAETMVINSDMVTRRFRRAQELIATGGDPEEALRELIWCYDVGMPQISGMSAVRTTSTMLFAKLGERYPAALAALRERRDRIADKMKADERNYQATLEYGAINRALKEDAATIAYLDSLPPTDRRRRSLASSSFDALIEAKRYEDAAGAQNFGSINSLFTRITAARPGAAAPSDSVAQAAAKQSAVNFILPRFEMLVGCGDIDHARELADRIVAYDSSDATRRQLQQRAERAGRPDLLSPVRTPSPATP